MGSQRLALPADLLAPPRLPKKGSYPAGPTPPAQDPNRSARLEAQPYNRQQMAAGATPLRVYGLCRLACPHRVLKTVADDRSTDKPYRPTETARQHYLASFAGERFAKSLRYVRPTLNSCLSCAIFCHLRHASAHNQRRERPCCATGQRERLPKSKLEIIDAKHFI